MSAVSRRPLIVAAADAALLVAVLASAPAGYAWLDGSRPAPLTTPSATATLRPTPSPSASLSPTIEPTASPMVPPVYGDGRWKKTMTLPEPLWGAAAVTLPDGRVLVLGGTTGADSYRALATTEIFDPRANYWALGPPMLEARAFPMAVSLADGSILVAGGSRNGQPLASAERFYPDGQTWVSAGEMSSPRTFATATLLRDGRVLLAAGGSGPAGSPSATATADLYDPATGAWSRTGSLATARAEHTAVLLSGGEVLVTGGATTYSGSRGSVLAGAEIYDPVRGTWRAAAPMSRPRYHHVAAALPDGRVLVAGGWSYTRNDDPSLAGAEIFDPGSGSWSAAAAMSVGRARARCLTLRDGSILVVGGVAPRYRTISTAERFVPATGRWQPAGELSAPVMWPAVAMLPDGRVLVAGGGLDSLGTVATSASALFVPQATS